jgi:hypothetical protein
MTMSFLGAGAVALIGIILVLIFDRPKRPKDTPADDQGNAKEPSHRLS